MVDEHGRVFDKTKTGDAPFYEKLYIGDASIGMLLTYLVGGTGFEPVAPGL